MLIGPRFTYFSCREPEQFTPLSDCSMVNLSGLQLSWRFAIRRAVAVPVEAQVIPRRL